MSVQQYTAQQQPAPPRCTQGILSVTSPRQRLREVAAILAAGYLRSRGMVEGDIRQASFPDGQFDLTSSADQSVHVVEPVRRRRRHA
jgi:hypothetical protein